MQITAYRMSVGPGSSVEFVSQTFEVIGETPVYWIILVDGLPGFVARAERVDSEWYATAGMALVALRRQVKKRYDALYEEAMRTRDLVLRLAHTSEGDFTKIKGDGNE